MTTDHDRLSVQLANIRERRICWLTCPRDSWTRRQVLKLMRLAASTALVPVTVIILSGVQSQAREWSTPKSFTRQLNGAKIHYRQWGSDSAPPLLLLHPAPLNAHVWEALAPVLASRFRVIAPDARGFGESEWSVSYEGDVYLNDLHALITTLKLRRIVLCGNSMGGTLAYMYAGLHPENVERLILIDTGPGEKTTNQPPLSATPTPRRGGPPPIPPGPFISPDDAAAQMPNAWGAAFIREMHNFNLKRDADGRWRWKYDPNVFLAYERSLNDPRKWPLWKAVKCPILVLRGERSPAFSQQAAEQMVAENKHASLIVIPGAGHFIPLEAAAALEETIRRWLRV